MTKVFNTGFALKIAPWMALLLSACLWGGALAFEHIGGFQPCQMCYWQRHAHKAVLAIAIATIIVRIVSKDGTWDKLFMIFLALALAVSFGLAFWHMGVEYKWWEGPKTCAGSSNNAFDMSAMTDILNGTKKVLTCSDAPWHMFKISMAGYNALFSGIASVLGFSVAFRGNTYD